MKSQIRVLGIDDGSFSFGQARTAVIGVSVRLPGYVEGVMMTHVEIDGLDSTDRIIDMLRNSRYLEQLKLIMLDGAAVGGFNVIDVHRLNRELDVPVITVTRDRPDYVEIENALRKHFEDWEPRLAMMRSTELEEFDTGHTPIYIGRVGMDREEVGRVLAASIVQGALPEALRIAHLIATAVARGESRGRA
jgi:hypothetical protein